jgi:hypothetical protein
MLVFVLLVGAQQEIEAHIVLEECSVDEEWVNRMGLLQELNHGKCSQRTVHLKIKTICFWHEIRGITKV